MFLFLVVVVVVIVVFGMISVVREIEEAEQHVQADSTDYSVLDKCCLSRRTLAAAAAVVCTRDASGAPTVGVKTYFAFSAFALASKRAVCAGAGIAGANF